uniref:Uncharacterized protein n=1 Tax=Medicago truncatula TaxID=3880 RepID=Q2HVS6_MEDTR|nr:hypothetical protein MtrDRAFT_AC148762g10v2 [Medicago truncatula]ABN08922.1 hypothetical protein MtrDRAFT_AC166313g22v2 [Medicago truncatula]
MYLDNQSVCVSYRAILDNLMVAIEVVPYTKFKTKFERNRGERDREERKRREVGDFSCLVRREIEKREE